MTNGYSYTFHCWLQYWLLMVNEYDNGSVCTESIMILGILMPWCKFICKVSCVNYYVSDVSVVWSNLKSWFNIIQVILLMGITDFCMNLPWTRIINWPKFSLCDEVSTYISNERELRHGLCGSCRRLCVAVGEKTVPVSLPDEISCDSSMYTWRRPRADVWTLCDLSAVRCVETRRHGCHGWQGRKVWCSRR